MRLNGCLSDPPLLFELGYGCLDHRAGFLIYVAIGLRWHVCTRGDSYRSRIYQSLHKLGNQPTRQPPLHCTPRLWSLLLHYLLLLFPFTLALLPTAVLGMWIGFQIQDKLDQDKFRKMTLIVIVGAALILLRKGVGL